MTKTASFEFLCLSRDPSQRRMIERVLGREGRVSWILLRPISLRRYEEARGVAERALANTPNPPSSRLMRALKLWHLRAQYSGARRLFQRRSSAVAVAWGGNDGGRMAFMEGARAAGAQRLYLELAPVPGRITVDPRGVNAFCSLPRTLEPYLAWAEKHAPDRKAWRAARRDIRQRAAPRRSDSDDGLPSLDQPFLFVPLQVARNTHIPEAFVSSLASAARFLPDGWHLRLKDHPSARISAAGAIRAADQPGSASTMTPTLLHKSQRPVGWSRSIRRSDFRRSISTSRWRSADKPSGLSPESPRQHLTRTASNTPSPGRRRLALTQTPATLL